jgi:multidrug transporter EmrE-like cation transporter
MEMNQISLSSLGIFVFVLFAQILAVSFIPRTAGFTNFYWAAACIGVYAISIWGMAHLIHTGTPLGLLIPVLAATVPLASIFLGLILFREPASVLKIVVLVGACGLIGIGSLIK